MLHSKVVKPETVPCKFCGDQTLMLGTKLCDRCWELRTRISRDIDLAKKIMAVVEKENAA